MRIAVPSSLPFSSGITRPTALAAPVEVGIADTAAARARCRSLCSVSTSAGRRCRREWSPCSRARRRTCRAALSPSARGSWWCRTRWRRPSSPASGPLWLTPKTIVASTPSAGAETEHLPRARGQQLRRRVPCLVKRPVHSIATSTPCSGSFDGSLFGGDLDRPDLAVGIPDHDGIVGHLDRSREAAMDGIITEQMRVGLDAAEVVDQRPATIRRARSRPIARNTSRPMRPKPLIATLTAMPTLPRSSPQPRYRHRGGAPSPRPPPAMLQPSDRYGRNDCLGSDAEMFVQVIVGRRGAEPGHADERAALAEPALPAEAARRLDADAGAPPSTVAR